MDIHLVVELIHEVLRWFILRVLFSYSLILATICLILSFILRIGLILFIELTTCLLLFFSLIFLWRRIYFWSCSRCFKLKFAISYFSSLFIGGGSIDLSATKYKSNFNSLIFNRLERSSYVNT